MATFRNRGALIAAAAIMLGLAAGCGAGGVKSDSASDSRAAPAIAPGTAGAGAPRDISKPANPATLQRSIIYRGAIVVRVDDVSAAATSADSIATGVGGYVGGDNRVVDSARSSATLTLRVPADKFDAAVEAISHLGKEASRDVSTQDVTAQVIDIDSRLATQKASVDRIRALLAQAKSISDIVSLESELTRREADLESLQAQQRSLADLTSLSTITATLLGPEAGPAKDDEPDQGGFVSGLKSGWHTFLASLRVLLTIIGALLPFLVAIGVPLMFVLWAARRRGRRRRAALAASGVGALPPAAPNAEPGEPIKVG